MIARVFIFTFSIIISIVGFNLPKALSTTTGLRLLSMTEFTTATIVAVGIITSDLSLPNKFFTAFKTTKRLVYPFDVELAVGTLKYFFKFSSNLTLEEPLEEISPLNNEDKTL